MTAIIRQIKLEIEVNVGIQQDLKMIATFNFHFPLTDKIKALKWVFPLTFEVSDISESYPQVIFKSEI